MMTALLLRFGFLIIAYLEADTVFRTMFVLGMIVGAMRIVRRRSIMSPFLDNFVFGFAWGVGIVDFVRLYYPVPVPGS